MEFKRLGFGRICAALLLMSAAIFAQTNDQICRWNWQPCSENTQLCLDRSRIDDDTVKLPLDITRIDRDGLKLCLGGVEIEAPVDIIFIVDMSGSMPPFSIDTSAGVFYHKDSKTSGYTKIGTMRIPYQYDSVDVEIITGSPTHPSGDPFGQRAIALRAGIDQLLQSWSSSQSTVGYIGFAKDIVSGHSLKPVAMDASGQAAVESQLGVLEEDIRTRTLYGGTNYARAMARALSWLRDGSVTPNNDQAIIFLSDGHPYETVTSSQITELNSLGVPVHGVFLGSGAPGGALRDVSNATGGNFFEMAPENSRNLSQVVEQIISTIQATYQPVGATARNLTTSITSQSASITATENDVYQVLLNNPLGLDEGVNEITVDANFSSEVGDTAISFNFFIDVSEDPQNCQNKICFPASELVFTTSEWVPLTGTDTLTNRDNQYNVVLTTYDTLVTSASIVARTESGDLDTFEVTTSEIKQDSQGQYYREFRGTMPFRSSATTTPNPGNGTTDAEARDSLFVRWEHPFDARDTAAAQIRVTTTLEPFALISIISPSIDSIHAGDTITAQVEILDAGVHLVGDTCFPSTTADSVVYQEMLGSPGGRTPPMAIVDGISGELPQSPGQSPRYRQCFSNGIATVRFVMHYAPFSRDSLNQISVRVGGLPVASTRPFRVLPAAVDSLVLESTEGVAVGGDTTLYAESGEYLYVISTGFDRYGNRIGTVDSRWRSDGSLNTITDSIRSNLFFTSEGYDDHTQGCIIVTAEDEGGNRVEHASDTICVTIVPPAASFTAFTQDTSGNGYLDRIVLNFNRRVALGQVDISSITLSYVRYGTTYNLTPQEVVSANGTDTSQIWYVNLTEVATDLPQTGWLPSIGFTHQKISTGVVTVADSAGPVIWRITKKVVDMSDREKDLITVQFSEVLDPIPGPSVAPPNVFHAWKKEGTLDFAQDDSTLSGIQYFNTAANNTVSQFNMLNGKDLTGDHYLNIRVDLMAAEVIDAAGNTPNANNQRVQVVIEGLDFDVAIGPNPMIPSGRASEDVLVFHTVGEVVQWARRDNGAAFVVDFPLPSSTDLELSGTLKVYDMIGNLVHTRESIDNLVPNSWKENWEAGRVRQMGIYWNGKNDREMFVKPGVYRALLDLNATYTGKNGTETHRFFKILPLGVQR